MVHQLIGSAPLIWIMQETAQQEVLPFFAQGFRNGRRGSFTNFEHDHKVVVTVWPRRLNKQRGKWNLLFLRGISRFKRKSWCKNVAISLCWARLHVYKKLRMPISVWISRQNHTPWTTLASRVGLQLPKAAITRSLRNKSVKQSGYNIVTEVCAKCLSAKCVLFESPIHFAEAMTLRIAYSWNIFQCSKRNFVISSLFSCCKLVLNITRTFPVAISTTTQPMLQISAALPYPAPLSNVITSGAM